jgi:hypothetical protein
MSWVEMAGVSHTHEQVIVTRLNANRKLSTTDNTGIGRSYPDGLQPHFLAPIFLPYFP